MMNEYKKAIDDLYQNIEFGINTLLESKENKSIELGKQIDSYFQELKSDEISITEFKDLVDDLQRVENINNAMSQLEIYNTIISIYNDIVEIKNLIPFI